MYRAFTSGPGVFDHDSTLDLLDKLSGQDTAERRKTLEHILRQSPDDLDYFAWVENPGEIVAAVAVVAAGLPQGDAVARVISRRGYDKASA